MPIQSLPVLQNWRIEPWEADFYVGSSSIFNTYLSVWLHRVLVEACGEFPDQGSNPSHLHWELRVLATGPPGKSLGSFSWAASMGGTGGWWEWGERLGSWVPICLPFSRDATSPGSPPSIPFSPGSDMVPFCPFLLCAGNRFSLLLVSDASPFSVVLYIYSHTSVNSPFSKVSSVKPFRCASLLPARTQTDAAFN